MGKVGGRLNFANVVSIIALFVALGGTGLAASQLGKNTVGTKQLKKNAVTTAKIKKEAITAAKVRKGTLTGAQINASTLGTVPTATRAVTAGHADSAGDSNTLQGSGADAFVQGSGARAAERRDLGKGETGVTLSVAPGVAELRVSCTAANQFGLSVTNSSGTTADFSFDPVGVAGVEPMLGVMGPGTDTELTTIEDGHVTWQVATRSTPASIATFDVTFGYGGPAACQFYAQADLGT